MAVRPGTLLWVVAAVKARFGWPTSRLRVSYRGREFLLRPETDEHAPSICIKDEDGLTLREGNDLINRLLSALAWTHSSGAHVEWVVGSNGVEPIRVGKGALRQIAEPWHVVYLPQPDEEKALRALAVCLLKFWGSRETRADGMPAGICSRKERELFGAYGVVSQYPRRESSTKKSLKQKNLLRFAQNADQR